MIISMDKMMGLVNGWKADILKDKQVLSDIKTLNEVLHEPSLDKHMACVADRILTRECCIMELQNLILTEQRENLDAILPHADYGGRSTID